MLFNLLTKIPLSNEKRDFLLVSENCINQLAAPKESMQWLHRYRYTV